MFVHWKSVEFSLPNILLIPLFCSQTVPQLINSLFRIQLSFKYRFLRSKLNSVHNLLIFPLFLHHSPLLIYLLHLILPLIHHKFLMNHSFDSHFYCLRKLASFGGWPSCHQLFNKIFTIVSIYYELFILLFYFGFTLIFHRFR